MAASPNQDRLAIGRVGTPKGVRGDLRIMSYSGEIEHFLKLKEVELLPGPSPVVEGRPRAELRREVPLKGAAAARSITAARAAASGAGQAPAAAPGLQRRGLRLKVIRIENGPGGLAMAFEGYASPEAARALTGMDIVVDRAKASPLGENEWYVADLVGLALVPPKGDGASAPEPAPATSPAETRGQTPFGRVVAVVEGGPDLLLETELPAGPRVLVPFRKEFIGEVDLAAGTIELLAPWILE